MNKYEVRFQGSKTVLADSLSRADEIVAEMLKYFPSQYKMRGTITKSINTKKINEDRYFLVQEKFREDYNGTRVVKVKAKSVEDILAGRYDDKDPVDEIWSDGEITETNLITNKLDLLNDWKEAFVECNAGGVPLLATDDPNKTIEYHENYKIKDLDDAMEVFRIHNINVERVESNE